MSFLPIPDVVRDDIFQISPAIFTNRGIRFIILDVDNTIAPYTCHRADERLKQWVEDMKSAGLAMFILSNNKGSRPSIFAEALGLEFENRAWKPFAKKARRVLAERGYTPEETAFIGDQIYTDILCAKSIGAFGVLVHPIEFSNPFLKIRYYLEFPFRLKNKWRKTK